MLNQKRSGKLARLKYLAAVPLCAGMLCASTLVFSKDYALIDLAPKRQADLMSDTAFAVRPPAVFGKDFSLQENGYLIDKKTPYITVTVTKTGGSEKIFNRTNATEADRKMLKEKYGFEFKKQEMMAFLKMASQSNKAFSNNPILPPPPPPVPVKEPYIKLAQFISQSIAYPKEAKGKKTKVALIASFNLGSDGRISVVSVTGSNDNNFINVLKNGLSKFSYPIKDKPGIKKMGVTFFMLGDKSPAIPSAIKNKPEFIGESGIVGMTDQQRKEYLRSLPPPPPPARPAKPSKIGFAPPKLKSQEPALPAVKDALEKEPEPVANAAPEIEIKRAKAPKPPKIKIINFTKSTAALPSSKDAVSNQNATKELYIAIAKTVRYPATAFENHITGTVITKFGVADGKISNVAIVKGVTNEIDKEVKRALEAYNGPLNLKKATYSIPISFELVNAKGKTDFKPKIRQSDASAPETVATGTRSIV